MGERTTTEHDRCSPVDVAVVGAGLAGLTAALTAARAGATVAVFDAGRGGGRARSTTVEPGVVFNGGPRALYRDGAAARELAALGVRWHGAAPTTRRTRLRIGEGTHQMPGTAWQLLRSGALGTRGTAQTAWLLGTISRRDPQALVGRSVAEWSAGLGLSPDARAMLLALVRLATYVDDPESFDAGAALMQLQLALGGGVEYLDGGWQTLVDQLVSSLAGVDAGVDGGIRVGVDGRVGVGVHDHSRVRSIDRSATGERWTVRTDVGTTDASSVVVAAGTPAAASALSPVSLALDGSGAPVTAACLELAVRGPLHVAFLLGVDVPLYLSQHSPPAALAPEGISVVHVLRYGAIGSLADPLADPGAGPATDAGAGAPAGAAAAAEAGAGAAAGAGAGAAAARAELWEHARRAQIDPADMVADRFLHRMVVSGGRPLAANGGLAGRPPVTVPGAPGLLLAGDWVGDEGLLADAAVASGVVAGRSAADHAARATCSP